MPLSLPFLQSPIQDATCHPITKSHKVPLAETVSQTCFILFWCPRWFEECWLDFQCRCWDFEDRVSWKPRQVSNCQVLSLKSWPSGLILLSSGIASMHHHFGSGLDALQNVERCLPCDCIWVVGFVEEDHSFNPIMPRAHTGNKACHCRQCWLPRCQG